MTMLPDQVARDRIATELDTTFVVEAAAGTGKTTALVNRMVAILRAGRTRLDRIVAVTFTEAAAGELKLRLREAIERMRHDAAVDAAERDRLRAALPHLEEARIGTIHAFCGDLLRARPVEARVDPRFQVAPDDVARGLQRQAFDRWFERQLEHTDAAVRRMLRRHDREGPRALLWEAAKRLCERHDFPTPWEASPFAREPAMDALVDSLAALAPFATECDASERISGSARSIAAFCDDLRRREQQSGARDYDGLEAELITLCKAYHWKNGPGRKPAAKYTDAVDRWQLRKDWAERRDAVRERLKDFVDNVGAELAPQLRDALWQVVEEYARLKRNSGYLDFLDLLAHARDLVRDNDEVRRELQLQYTHLFVDEFQDTDPLQAEILLLLAARDGAERDWRRAVPVAGKLFLVGDPKQSIYRFRRADVALYRRIQHDLQAVGAELVELHTSFRSQPRIQRTVNAALAPCMDGTSPSQAPYVALSALREDRDEQPAVVVLPVPQPYKPGTWGKIFLNKEAVLESAPAVVAGSIEWLVRHSGWLVSEENQWVPVQPRHVCLLFKRFKSWEKDITRGYVEALEARGLPHVLVGGSSLHSRDEVEAIRNALCAIERPDDELSVYATLRGPLFALTDGVLLAFREAGHRLHPFAPIPEDVIAELGTVRDALAILRRLHLARNRRPIAATISELLSATRAHAGLAIWSSGEQALANVNRLLDMARRAERNGVISFRAFTDQLVDEAAHSEMGEAPIIEEGSDGVRLMTVHKAKGLEFPVVVLCDPGASWPGNADRWVDSDRALCAMQLAGCAPRQLLEHQDEELMREREETVRLLYVAATRARDLLVVTSLCDPEEKDGAVDFAWQESWLAPLYPALYPVWERARQVVTAVPQGCPAMGEDGVVERMAPRPQQSVRPGQHRPRAAGADVVWWDPALLRLAVEASVGLRQQQLLRPDIDSGTATHGVERQAAWQAERAAVRDRAARRALRLVTATELAHGDEALPDSLQSAVVEVVEVGSRHGRPHGKRFGTLVHAVLATVELNAAPSDIERAAELQGRLLGATDDERRAAATAAREALAHPLMRRAAQAASCHREVPVAARFDDGRVIEGIIDLAFVDDDAWTVVDFKTDVDARNQLDAYRRQVAAYGWAIEQSTGRTARGVLLMA